MKNKEPPKWSEVYPQGTKEGDEELKFWISISRNPKWAWRSTAAIAKESGLSKEKVEQIIQKYLKKGMVFNNPKNEDQWGYWENVKDQLPKDKGTLDEQDKKDRINKFLKK